MSWNFGKSNDQRMNKNRIILTVLTKKYIRAIHEMNKKKYFLFVSHKFKQRMHWRRWREQQTDIFLLLFFSLSHHFQRFRGLVLGRANPGWRMQLTTWGPNISTNQKHGYASCISSLTTHIQKSKEKNKQKSDANHHMGIFYQIFLTFEVMIDRHMTDHEFWWPEFSKNHATFFKFSVRADKISH